MRTLRLSQFVAATLASAAMLVPSGLVMAAEPARRAESPIIDISLTDGGRLEGQVIDSYGNARPGVEVRVHCRELELKREVADEQGRFAVDSLKGGVVELSAGQGTQVCRVWATGTAPPAARSSALVVDGPEVIRGQRPLPCWLRHPWLVGGIIATAIAVPVALNNVNTHKSGS